MAATQSAAASDGRGDGELMSLSAETRGSCWGERRDAGLMVIGHRGAGVLKALSLGSTADWLLHPAGRSAGDHPVGQAREESAAVRGRLVPCEGCRAGVGGHAVDRGVPSGDSGRRGWAHPAGPAIEEASCVVREAGADPVPLRREAFRRSAAFDVRGTILEMIRRGDPDLVALGTRGDRAGPAHHARVGGRRGRAPRGLLGAGGARQQRGWGRRRG